MKKIKKLSIEHIYWNELFEQNNTNLRLNQWIAEKRSESIDDRKKVQTDLIHIDGIFKAEIASDLIADMDFLTWCDTEDFKCYFSEGEQTTIRAVIDFFTTHNPNVTIPTGDIQDLQKKINILKYIVVDSSVRPLLDHIHTRLLEFFEKANEAIHE